MNEHHGFPTQLTSGAYTTDIHCPHCYELVNVQCWKCHWKRDPEERKTTIAGTGGWTYRSPTGELHP